VGTLVSPRWLRVAAWTIAAVVVGLNATLLVGFL